MNKRNKRIGITLGDPQGIGPEIVRKSLEHHKPGCITVIIGALDSWPDISMPVIQAIDEARHEGLYFYHIEAKTPPEPSFAYVKTGVELALAKKIAALVTAPISKEKWLKAGVKHAGHSQYLAESAGIKEWAMAFWSKEMKVVLFTSHIPLKQVFPHIKKEKIVHFIQFVHDELFKLFKKRFLFLISGLNPHAGEGGLLGSEEADEIIPAIRLLKQEGAIAVAGPFPPDTIFLKARQSKDAVVVCWYHDQGLIPFKLLNIHSGVNLTLGLPYIRTAPDHGTAFDIAGKGTADPGSMTAAIKLAEQLILSSSLV